MQHGHTYITLLHLPGATDMKENLILSSTTLLN